MADKTPEQEPSIEEILASIRQIISDDEDKDAGEEPPAADVQGVQPEAAPADGWHEDGDEVLDLTDPIPPEPVVAEEKEYHIDLQDLHGAIEEEIEPEPIPESEPEPAYAEPEAAHTPPPEPPVELPHTPAAVSEPRKEAPTMDDILTAEARSAAISSMAKLAGNMPITRHRAHGDITLEDLVREMLTPMLKDWMSENLPPMVERMVQKELEKLARQAQDV